MTYGGSILGSNGTRTPRCQSTRALYKSTRSELNFKKIGIPVALAYIVCRISIWTGFQRMGRRWDMACCLSGGDVAPAASAEANDRKLRGTPALEIEN